MASNGAVVNGASNGDHPPVEEPKKMGFFDSVLTPPDWLDQSYLEKVLRDHEKDPNLKIGRYTMKPCTKPGDNFVGVIFRATISYATRETTKEETFIVKIEPFMEGFKKDLMANQPFFTTEGRMYTEILPVFQELLKNSGDTDIIAPELIHYSENPKILIFQDIAPQKFTMVHMPVGFEKAAQVARKLGKFHACSYYLKQEQGENSVVTTFQDGFFSVKLAGNWDFVEQNISVLAELAKGWGGPEFKLISEKLTALQPHFMQKMMDIYVPKPGALNLLNHGDFHIRNLMFRFGPQEDSPLFEALRLIDFQLSVYATPAIDLFYLLYVISDREVRDQNRNQILKVYHDQFTETLNGLGYLGKVPTMLDFQVELLRNGLIEFFITANFLSMFFMDPSQMADLDFTNQDHMKQLVKDMFETTELKSILMQLLPELLYKGILDL